MARIDFYILSQAGERARQTFACRLTEKAYRLNNTVHIETVNPADAARLDELLWTYRDESFVPHHVVGSSDMDSPVTIGCQSDAIEAKDLLINLSDDIPPIAASFPRIAELISSDQDCKQRGRTRFARYRDQGHDVDTHTI